MGGETAEVGRAPPLLHLDLHNFEEQASRYVLTSPRSLEACARLGVLPMQLLRKPLRQFLCEHPAASQLGAMRLYEEAERRRRRTLRRCQRERQKLLLLEEEAAAPPTTPVPEESASSTLTAEDQDYKTEIERSEEWLRGPGSFTHWDEVPDRGDGKSLEEPPGGGGGRRLQQTAETAARKSWSSGDVNLRGSANAHMRALQLARDIEREARVSLPAKDCKIATLMLVRHQEEQERQERGLRAAWVDLKDRSAERGGGSSSSRRTGQPPEKSKVHVLREKRYKEHQLQEKENADKPSQPPKTIGQALRAKLLKELEERRRIDLDSEYDRIRHLHLKQHVDQQLRVEEKTRRSVLEKKLQRSKGAYELLIEEKTKELKERVARESELLAKAKMRAGAQEQQQKKRKEQLLQKTNQKIQYARESVVKHSLEKAEKVKEVNTQKERAHSLLKQRMHKEEECHRREIEQFIRRKDKRSDQILKEKEASQEESRKIARASFQMRERVREQINSRPFNQMVLEAQLNASLIKQL
uniref:Coiled-coil domain-containing protein 185 n=1 Tax=Geotrypetes seraphini TaxID=260995 RepID=A0A6P8R018_GEOSA|nr:coiled-coil domain-containing protein 185 [Geotrypetes seraphini]